MALVLVLGLDLRFTRLLIALGIPVSLVKQCKHGFLGSDLASSIHFVVAQLD